MAEKRQEKIREVIKRRQEGVIVLEDIHDPHNAAAVWRSCDGFGFQKVYLIFEKEKPFNPKKVGKTSSSSANKWLDFKIFRSTKAGIEELKKDGYKIAATVLDKGAKKLSEVDFKTKKVAIMLGNEHRGLSETALKLADEKIYIPMKGMVQSFNLSVTAAIVMYEIDRQRRGEKFSLSKKEKGEIEKRWEYN
jgi:tRNA (guanosine-2'-O-)-methyltransferase